MAENKRTQENTTIEDIVGETQQSQQPTDPFARLQKENRRVARPKTIHVQWRTKRGSKLSPKVFLAWCLIFVIVFLGLAFAGLYFAISSSEVLQRIGLEVDSVKNVLLLFAWLFFGLIFFGGFYVFVLNIYRLITVKTKRKIKYGLGLFLWFIIIIGAIIGGVISIERIKSISWTTQIQTNLLVIPWVQTRDGPVLGSDGIPLITPMKINFQLNKPQFDQNILRQIGTSNPITGYQVDCGNGQTISAPATINVWWAWQWWWFADHCLYTQKWAFPITLTVNYTERTTWNARSQTFDVTTMQPQAAIDLTPSDGEPALNDKKTEYIIGVAPVSVDVRAQTLFSELELPEDKIAWDFDGDEVADIIDNASFTYPFDQSKLHTIAYQLPGHPDYNETWFTFDLRVIESELAQCGIEVTSLENERYRFSPQFDELVDVATYHYTIYDMSRDTMLEKSRKISDDSWNYTFTQWWKYQIQVSYFTPEGLKWSCRSEELTIWLAWNTVDFTTRYRQSPNEPFINEWDWRIVVLDEVNREIAITSIPVTLELSVDAVRPDPNAKVQLYYDERQVFSDRNGVFEIAIANLGSKTLEFVTTTAQWKEDRQPYTVEVSRSPLRANMIAEPMVWEDPVEVTLDASISDLYDEDDEIVYFTRDFWDGESRTNVSQWKITHTYTYDVDKDSWEYYPAVTVRTKKWEEDSYRLETPIIVKKTQKTVDLRVDSHPTRQARLNEIVTFGVQTDWIIDRIERDFGNGKVFGCDGRTCTTAPIQYTEPWTYQVKAEVFYADDIPVVGRTTVRVY